MSEDRLRVEQRGEVWVLAGEDAAGFGLVNGFLAHLVSDHEIPQV